MILARSLVDQRHTSPAMSANDVVLHDDREYSSYVHDNEGNSSAVATLALACFARST
jgi:hypothetical protein